MAEGCYVFPGGSADPCSALRCELGARCQVAPDGQSASCVCPQACPRLGDHSGSRPLCGDDGRDYPDMCTLTRTSCTTNSPIHVKYHGKCDPCSDTVCGGGEVCQVGEGRIARCSCGEMCPLELSPVCASDGKTYANECHLRMEACRSRRPLQLIYRGHCHSGVNPCRSVECREGEHCVIDRTGIASCQCDYRCEHVVRPVCGSDGTTYDSECHLKKSACLNQTRVRVSYSGFCNAEGVCSSYTCDHGATCVERAGRAVCECPQCPAEFSPVCGSDGVSYGNECKLRLQACLHSRHITVLYTGLCNGCENKKCDYFGICENDVNGEAICVCPQNCTQEGPQVCGSNGETYPNECELKKLACLTKKSIQIAYVGDCGQPVCGSDLRLYPSLCAMRTEACQRQEELRLRPLDLCQGMEVKPCQGEQPLVGPDGQELDCGNGHNRQDCPSDSYCHQTPHFAKCCKKGN
ncbi:hypothetical protein AAG570_005333 [Ranatra chinensis]|uniref:Kazal-like domain-containing protein n=1 Tax=Ranatra chinensis TaxID=642074 RepID=A0ABD0YLX4_9HEMI